MAFRARFRLEQGTLLLACVLAVFGSAGGSAQSMDAAGLRANAIAFEQRGENAEAEQAWRTIAETDPRNAEALAHLGLLEARQNRLENAIGFYRRAIALNPELPGLQMNLGLALFKGAQFPDAMKAFSAEIEKHPDDQRLTILLGMAHYGMKDYFVAIPYLRRAANHDPQNLTLRMALARSCLLSKQYGCVMDVHREIKLLKPEAASADMLAAEALDAQRDHDGAVAQARAALQANPDEINAHFALAYLLWKKGEWAEAVREFKAELERYPENTEARIYLADSQVQGGDFAAALPELQKVVASGSSEALLHLDLGTIAAKQGHTEDAFREFSAATKIASANAEISLRIAKQLELLGRTEESRLERERANRLPQPEYPSLLDILEPSQ
jgi:tetratricopeptide (TPR) repeat protein